MGGMSPMGGQELGGSSSGGSGMDLLGDFMGGGGGGESAATPESSKGKKKEKKSSKKSSSKAGGDPSASVELYEYWAPFAVGQGKGGAPAVRGAFKCRMDNDGGDLELSLRCTNAGAAPLERLMLVLPALPGGFRAGGGSGSSQLSMLLCSGALAPGATTEEVALLKPPLAMDASVKLSGSIT